MLDRFRCAVAATSLFAAIAAPAAALTPSEIFAKVSPSVWLVHADHAAAGVGEDGSAVMIGARTVVTACHVVDGATSVRISREGGKLNVPVAQVTKDPDRARDLCLLTVSEDLPGAPAAIAPIDSVKVGERVYAVGAPLRLELSLTDGLVSALRPVANEPLPDIQVSATTAPGSSGGGLFDEDGRLVGVTLSIAGPNSETISFAYPAQWVLELPNRVLAARQTWREHLAASGLPMGADGDAAASGYAEISDLTKIPLGDKPAKGVADAYRQFLLLSKPRAFLLTSDNRWGTVTDAVALDGLMRDCAAKGVRCRFYAVDDAVVWRP
jgi:serine protease Do